MARFIPLSEQDGYRELSPGDIVVSTNPIVSCCLIVVVFQNGIAYAQHCRASSLKEELDNIFFCGEPKEVLMVSGPASEYQKDQARWLRSKERYSNISFVYYAYNIDDNFKPVISYSVNGFIELQAKEKYDIITFDL